MRLGGGDQRQTIPKELERRYQLFFTPGKNQKKLITKLREIKGDHIGHLLNVRGIVTRVSDVKPCMQVAAYMCDVCGCEIYQVVS